MKKKILSILIVTILCSLMIIPTMCYVVDDVSGHVFYTSGEVAYCRAYLGKQDPALLLPQNNPFAKTGHYPPGSDPLYGCVYYNGWDRSTVLLKGQSVPVAGTGSGVAAAVPATPVVAPAPAAAPAPTPAVNNTAKSQQVANIDANIASLQKQYVDAMAKGDTAYAQKCVDLVNLLLAQKAALK